MCEINLLFSVYPASKQFAQHTRGSADEVFNSPGFPNQPYSPNSFVQWQLRGDPGHVLKLSFDTFNLEENCSNDFVRVYDSLVAMDTHLMAEWVVFVAASGGVMCNCKTF